MNIKELNKLMSSFISGFHAYMDKNELFSEHSTHYVYCNNGAKVWCDGFLLTDIMLERQEMRRALVHMFGFWKNTEEGYYG